MREAVERRIRRCGSGREGGVVQQRKEMGCEGAWNGDVEEREQIRWVLMLKRDKGRKDEMEMTSGNHGVDDG